MKQTKENIIKLLKAKYKLAHALADYAKENGDEEEFHMCIREAIAISDAIYLLTNKEYFNSMVEIYFKEDEE